MSNISKIYWFFKFLALIIIAVSSFYFVIELSVTQVFIIGLYTLSLLFIHSPTEDDRETLERAFQIIEGKLSEDQLNHWGYHIIKRNVLIKPKNEGG